MRIPALLAALSHVALAGCVRYHARPLSPAGTAQAFGSRTLDNPALREFIEASNGRRSGTWPLPSWGLDDLTLAAFYYHPDLDLARAQWALATAATRSAGERPNPELNLTPGYNTTTRTPTPWIPLGLLNIPLETSGKRGHRVEQARHLAEAARLNVASIAWQVRSRVRSSLVAFQAARDTEALLAGQRADQTENVRILEHQLAAGGISPFELAQARIAADSARLAWRDAESQGAAARVALADAVGLPIRALEGADISREGLDLSPEEPALADLRRQALTSRADILAALAEYEASQSAVRLEIAKQYPDLQLGPGYEYDQGDHKWSLGLTLPLPLFSRNRGPIAEALARRDEAAARFTALQAKVLADIERAVAGYHAALAKESDTEALLVELKKQEARAQAMLGVGEIGKSEWLGLRLQLGAAALARLEAVTRSQEARGALEDALQSPLGVPPEAWQAPPRAAAGGKGDRHP